MKRLVADLSLDKVMLQDVIPKNSETVKQQDAMRYLVGRYQISQRGACRVIRATRSLVYYRSRRDPLTALRQRLRELAQTRVRFGYRRALDSHLLHGRVPHLCAETSMYAQQRESADHPMGG